MTWQARRRFGLRERSRSSLLLPLLPTTTPSRVLHAAPRSRLRASSRTALAAADLPAECRQLGHRSVKSSSSRRSGRFMFLASWLPGESAGLHIANRREYHHSSQPTSKSVLCSSILLCLCTAGLCVACLHKQRHPSARRASRSGQMGVF